MQKSLTRGGVARAFTVGLIMAWPGGATTVLAQGERSIAGVDCTVTYADGNFDNRKPNYSAMANRAAFAFLAPMKTVAEGAMLYSAELGDATTEGVAAIKGTVVRNGDGEVSIEALQLAWPFTVLSVGGQYQGVIQMAHEQGVSVGLSIISSGESLGTIDFAKGAFDPAVPIVGFSPDAAGPIHAGLMSSESMVISLEIAGQPFSIVSPEPGAYGAFINETLVPAMNEAMRRDAEDPCTFVDDDAYLDLLKF